MKYKLKHLSKFCCRPANEIEFEDVKMAAEIGGVEIDEFEWPNLDDDRFTHAWVDDELGNISWARKDDEITLTCLDFIKKLRMSEEEARELEDDRVDMTNRYIHRNKSLICNQGFQWRTNEDRTEAYLVKKD